MSGLFGSRVLEAALGMACVYLSLAMFCSTVNEWIASLLAVRSQMLQEGLARLLGGALKEFYSHPMIQALMHGGEHPEHIAPNAFAKALMDLATPNQTGALEFEDLERGIANDLPPGPLRTSLLAVLQGTEKRVDAAERAIEKWFEGAMNGLSRSYQKRTQTWTAILAAAITIAANADTLRMARAILSGQEAAGAIGWAGAPTVPGAWMTRVVGWMLTTAAVSLGAPFWFDAARNLLAATRPRVNSRGN